MKVILNEDIEKVGRLGDLVDVKAGYARNYLFPRDMALLPTAHNVELMKTRKKKALKRLELEKLSAIEQKQKIEGITLTISKKAGETDTLFGSVTPAEIEAKLQEMGVAIERKKFHLDEPIKKLGSYICKVRLMEEVEAELKIEVVKEGDDQEEVVDDAQ